ncbi:hypothetical protein IWQ60_000360 [Tieghemiomyces parasiticus]|uniref:Large ribosomal subunit protein mL54 n=1 Tax=Tieghemiomyces parasiticus TaxID=78921 RepID=A0A9W8AMB6_9FUNG|nr:hypothetical protein IWQ60_000360 [Tieghemiomyces parasiticus]
MLTRIFTKAAIRPGPIAFYRPSLRSLSTSPLSRKGTPEAVSETAITEPNHPVSMAPEGTVLKGLNFRTDGKDPVALKDEEYPAWLWTLTDTVASEELSDRLRLKRNNKERIKAANYMRKKK